MGCLVLCLTDSCLLFKTNLRCTSSRKASLNSLPFCISSTCSCFFSSGSEGSSLATYLKYSRHSVKVCYMNEWTNGKSLAVAVVGYVPVCMYICLVCLLSESGRFLCTDTEDSPWYAGLSFFFFYGPFFKVSIKFVTILLLFYVLVFWPQGMWNPSSLTRDWTPGLPALEGKILTTGPPGKCPPQYTLYKNKKPVIRQKNNSIFVKNICVYVLGKVLEAMQQIIVFQESEVDSHYFLVHSCVGIIWTLSFRVHSSYDF